MAKIPPASFWTYEFEPFDRGWKKIEEEGGIQLNAAHRDSLLVAMNEYRFSADEQQASLRPSEVRPVVNGLLKALQEARRAICVVISSGPETEVAMALLKGAAGRHDSKAFSDEISALEAELAKWEQFAAVAAKSLPAEMGREADPALDHLILKAHAIFKDAGGDGKYTEASLAFIASILHISGAPEMQPDTVGHRLHRLLGKS